MPIIPALKRLRQKYQTGLHSDILSQNKSNKQKPKHCITGSALTCPHLFTEYTDKVGCQWLSLIILATWETETGRILVTGQPRQMVHETPICRITRAKWTGGVTQVVLCLLCKCEALSSNSSPTKNKPTKIKTQVRISIYHIAESTWHSHLQRVPIYNSTSSKMNY
jgi:hypothetical protein